MNTKQRLSATIMYHTLLLRSSLLLLSAKPELESWHKSWKTIVKQKITGNFISVSPFIRRRDVSSNISYFLLNL